MNHFIGVITYPSDEYEDGPEAVFIEINNEALSTMAALSQEVAELKKRYNMSLMALTIDWDVWVASSVRENKPFEVHRMGNYAESQYDSVHKSYMGDNEEDFRLDCDEMIIRDGSVSWVIHHKFTGHQITTDSVNLEQLFKFYKDKGLMKDE